MCGSFEGFPPKRCFVWAGSDLYATTGLPRAITRLSCYLPRRWVRPLLRRRRRRLKQSLAGSQVDFCVLKGWKEWFPKLQEREWLS